MWLRPLVPFYLVHQSVFQVFKGYGVYWFQGGIVHFRPWDVKFKQWSFVPYLWPYLCLCPHLTNLDWSGKGFGICCLQNEHVAPDCSHTFWGMHFIMLILFASIGSVPNILTQLVLIWLKQWLCLDHLVLTLPRACFLGFLGGFVGVLTRGI